jgi:hypothetical protein
VLLTPKSFTPLDGWALQVDGRELCVILMPISKEDRIMLASALLNFSPPASTPVKLLPDSVTELVLDPNDGVYK